MGGDLTVETAAGKGTTFTLSIPQPFDRIAAPCDNAAETGSGIRALVVDPLAVRRELMTRQLVECGIAATTADSVASASSQWRTDAQRPRVVLIDNSLFDGSATKLIDELSEAAPDAPPAIVVLSEVADRRSVDTLRAPGPTAILHKPWLADELYAVLEAVLVRDPVSTARTRCCEVAPAGGPVTFDTSNLEPVLVVDDNEVNRLIARHHLESIGLNVEVATNGHDALNRIRETSYAAVLMDCEMPVMDGLAATRSLRDWETTAGRQRTPVIALTAHAFSEHQEKCRKAGMDAYLSKPYRREQLLEALTVWLGDHRPFDASGHLDERA